MSAYPVGHICTACICYVSIIFTQSLGTQFELPVGLWDPSGVDWPWVQMEGGGSHPTHATQSKIPNTSRAVGRAYTRVGQHAHLSFIPFPPFQIVRVGLWEGRGAKGWEN